MPWLALPRSCYKIVREAKFHEFNKFKSYKQIHYSAVGYANTSYKSIILRILVFYILDSFASVFYNNNEFDVTFSSILYNVQS